MKTSMSRVVVMSVLSLLGALLVSYFWQAGTVGLLLGLFIFGVVAGWNARRAGWLCGIIVGLPLALFHLTRSALPDYPSLAALFGEVDYWRLVVPASVVSTGMSIMGGIVGAWLQDMKYKRGT
ncbi:MAG TPA: hypothetical protein P5079_04195 [Elusimicrobiota bacterium]|nr:hypothetical protein [Elusimicrobiota bacterium]